MPRMTYRISSRRSQVGGRASLALLAMLLSACAVIGHERVEGWPQLDIVEHYVPEAQMRDRCGQYTGFGTLPQACAEFDLSTRRCDIWFSADFPPNRDIVEHERLHCRGYDHIGASTMRSILARHQGENGLAASAGGGRPE
jgi:hypothetical protein